VFSTAARIDDYTETVGNVRDFACGADGQQPGDVATTMRYVDEDEKRDATAAVCPGARATGSNEAAGPSRRMSPSTKI
jgi:hypothetical protein